ncbi:MAG: transposase [Candidatus Methanosuratincola sp.]
MKVLKEQIKALVKEFPEWLMREERAPCLEKPPTKANKYYTRNFLTLAGPVELLRIRRIRKGKFCPRILPYQQRTSVELSEAFLDLYVARVSRRAVSVFA